MPAGVGAVVLLILGNLVSGLACLVATPMLGVFGCGTMVFQVLMRPLGRYVTLAPAEYFDAVEAAKRSIGPSSTREERIATAERLWALANELSGPAERPL